MNNKFSLSLVTFVATLLVTKVARGQQQEDFEQCGETCGGPNLLVRGKRYINCSPTPFVGGELDGQITLPNIANDITSDALGGNTSDVTVVSFPCMTTSPQSVDLSNGGSTFPNLARVRFTNWKEGPEIAFYVRDMPALKRIYAPRLEGTSNLNVIIEANLNLTKVNLPLLEFAGDVRITDNRSLVRVNLPVLRTVALSFSSAGGVTIENNENLANIDLSALTFVPQQKFVIRDNNNPVKVSLPQTTGDPQLYLVFSSAD